MNQWGFRDILSFMDTQNTVVQ